MSEPRPDAGGQQPAREPGDLLELSMLASNPPPLARQLFEDRLGQAQEYVRLLATTGLRHGLLGPREAARLWDRHIINCAVLEKLIARRVTVVDVGSGAGLPGIPLAIARPDIDVHLVEPLLRRTRWLNSTVADLGLVNVQVHRCRSEEYEGPPGGVVVSRAVAKLDVLASWSVRTLAPGGIMLAIKGRTAQDEVEESRPALRRLRVAKIDVLRLGVGCLDEPTTVVRMAVTDAWGARGSEQRGRHRRVKTQRSV